ncbi:MAG: hypothetical protein IT383_26755 [Deltaproteobacteria bacterium]|nr:hypothetical protein [Deltaproteobacteria bacterium]
MLHALALALATMAAPVLKAELRLTPARGEVGAELTLVNLSSTTLVLVEPGDGSEMGWRTPILTWTIEPLDDAARASATLAESWGRFCGNINALGANEVFELAPGARHTFGPWVSSPHPRGPGRWRVSLRYQNQPTLAWGGVPLGEHDGTAMQRVRASSAVDVTSNAIEIEVSNDGFALPPASLVLERGPPVAELAASFYRRVASTIDARRPSTWSATLRLPATTSLEGPATRELPGWTLENFVGADGHDLVFIAQPSPADERAWLALIARLEERARGLRGARLVELGLRQGPVPYDSPLRTPLIVR